MIKQESKIFKKNLIMAFLAQIISLGSSLLVSFFVPKWIGIEDFSYWQLFVFYVTYINLSRLGIIDGLYLRNGGKQWSEIDKSLLGTEWKYFSLFQLIISIIFFNSMYFLGVREDRLFVLLFCSICIFVINSSNFLGYILQAINETKIYSYSVIIFNLFWFIAVGIIYFLKYYSYKIIVLMYVLGQIVAWLYLIIYCRKIVFAPTAKRNLVFNDLKENFNCGIKLMIATYVSMLIIGSARFVIDAKWGIETFGLFSFSLTLSNLFLTFISQVSMVLFPAMKRLGNKKQRDVFLEIEDCLDVFLPAILLGYVPIKAFIDWWLPAYSDSVRYLCFLLPICIFDGKMQMIYSTYLKVIRKEKSLMIINIFSVILCFLISIFGAYFLNNLYVVICGIIVTIAIRSWVSKIYIQFIIEKNFSSQNISLIISELGLILVFSVFGWYLGNVSMVIYLAIYLFFLLCNKRKVIKSMGMINKKLFH